MNESVTRVPADKVGRVVQDFVDDGARTVVVTRDDDGTFTVSRDD
ncbi:MAG TPA: hypothetical protein VEK11_20050 [Thermoanaerobaculia bacterium]|nr:hypothetical protein [Thermoanaerobaculia bacterium]